MGNDKHFVGGRWVGGSGASIVSTNPTNGDQILEVAELDVAAIATSTEYLRDGQLAWEARSVDDRIDVLRRFVELVHESGERLTHLVAAEVGKPLWEAATEVNAIAAKLAPAVEFHDRRASGDHRQLGALESLTRFRALGVCAVIGPFNFPLSMVNTHVMPALLAGNAVVIKPSEQAPALAVAYVELLLEAGVPPDVISLVHGGPAVALQLVDACDGIFLTGSAAAGRAISARASSRADNPVLALEMGGNNPLIVWDYSDVEPVVFGVIQSAFISAGQRCSAARRLIVRAEDVDLLPRLRSATESLVVGAPDADPAPYLGPMISARSVDRLFARYDELLNRGAQVVVPLRREGDCLVSPGILDVFGVDYGDEEHFGPLLLIDRVRDLGDAIARANNTQYGLAAGIYCRSRADYERFRLGVRAGIVNWNQALTGAVGNAPFGGAKASGNHRPGGSLSVDYCVYAVASLETEDPRLPATMPPGLAL